MNKTERQALRRQLESTVARLQPDVRTILESTRSASGGQGDGELSNAPMHLADGGTDEYLHELNATILENEGYLLVEVQAAIARLDDGTFGRCEGCGVTIASERLKALPQARLCIRCATNDIPPQANLNTGRPRGPADTLADEEEMGIKGREAKSTLTDMMSSQETQPLETDSHAVGTPGGGSATGGMAGTTQGDGVPDLEGLHEEMGSGDSDATEGADENRLTPTADRTGSAVKGTPATRR